MILPLGGLRPRHPARGGREASGPVHRRHLGCGAFDLRPNRGHSTRQPGDAAAGGLLGHRHFHDAPDAG